MDRGTEIRGIRMHAVAVRALRTRRGPREELNCDPDCGFVFLFPRSRQGIGVVCRA